MSWSLEDRALASERSMQRKQWAQEEDTLTIQTTQQRGEVQSPLAPEMWKYRVLQCESAVLSLCSWSIFLGVH